MPDYKYQGTSRSGGSVSGTMTASNKTELAGLLKRQQITATKMTEKGKEFNTRALTPIEAEKGIGSARGY